MTKATTPTALIGPGCVLAATLRITSGVSATGPRWRRSRASPRSGLYCCPIRFIRMIVTTRTMIAVQIHLNRHHCPANPAAIPVSRTRPRKGYITRVDSVESTTSERMESGDVSRRRRNPIAAEAPWARTKPTTEVTCRKTSQAYGISSGDYAAAAGGGGGTTATGWAGPAGPPPGGAGRRGGGGEAGGTDSVGARRSRRRQG